MLKFLLKKSKSYEILLEQDFTYQRKENQQRSQTPFMSTMPNI
jgi:hypothetical protein